MLFADLNNKIEKLEELNLYQCHSCQKVINDKSFINLDPYYFHLDHLLCYKCNKQVINEKYFEVEGKLFCESDYLKKYGKICSNCKKYIQAEYINIEGSFFHPNCYLCQKCKKILKENMKYFSINQQKILMCQHCEEQYLKSLQLCTICKKPILDNGIYYKQTKQFLHENCAQNKLSKQNSEKEQIEKKVVQSQQQTVQDLNEPKSELSTIVTYPCEKLKSLTASEIDITKKEQYLDDAEFQKIFKMTKKKFSLLKPWRQALLKKEANLD